MPKVAWKCLNRTYKLDFCKWKLPRGNSTIPLPKYMGQVLFEVPWDLSLGPENSPQNLWNTHAFLKSRGQTGSPRTSQMAWGPSRWDYSLCNFLWIMSWDQFSFTPSSNTISSYQHLPIYLWLMQMICHTIDLHGLAHGILLDGFLTFQQRMCFNSLHQCFMYFIEKALKNSPQTCWTLRHEKENWYNLFHQVSYN